MDILQYSIRLVREIREQKRVKGLTCQAISDMSGISLRSVQKVCSSTVPEDTHFRLTTLLPIANALGIDTQSAEINMELAREVNKLEDKLQTEIEIVASQKEQIVSMRDTIKKHEVTERKQSKRIAVVVAFCIVLLCLLCIALAFDFLQPSMGWIMR